MANLQDVAQLASDRIGAVIARARPVARGVALLSTASGGMAYLVGALVFRGGWRYGWMLIGLLVCALPAWALWMAYRRLTRAVQALPAVADSLQLLQSDRDVRDALFELADNHGDTSSVPLTTLGKELLRLRSAVSKHRSDLTDLIATITAVTTLPGLLAIGIVGSFGLLVLSVVFVVGGLAL